MEAAEWLPDLVVPGGAIGGAVWLFWRFVLRADGRERDTFREVKEQRDYWRDRAEVAEHELVRYTARFGPLDGDGA